MCKRIYLLLLIVGCSSYSSSILADEVEVVRVSHPHIVVFDRRPEKNIHYSKCVARFRTGGGDVLEAAVSVEEDRLCPKADAIVLDNQPDKILSDAGKTVTRNHIIPVEEFDRAYTFEGKDWKLMSQPSKVTTQIKEVGASGRIVEDVFFVSTVWNEDTKKQMIMVSDKADSITDVFETRHKTYEPMPPVDESKLTRHSQQTRTTERPTHR